MLVIRTIYNIFANSKPEGLPPSTSPDGGIGRRAGLKHQWSNPCRFDPGSGYDKILQVIDFQCLQDFSFCQNLKFGHFWSPQSLQLLYHSLLFLLLHYSRKLRTNLRAHLTAIQPTRQWFPCFQVPPRRPQSTHTLNPELLTHIHVR